jgi:prevent-host-death family protein
MNEITMVDFRRHADRILAQVEAGQTMILTYRGKPVARLAPIRDEFSVVDDQFYSLCDLREPAGALSNQQIDAILYRQ